MSREQLELNHLLGAIETQMARYEYNASLAAILDSEVARRLWRAAMDDMKTILYGYRTYCNNLVAMDEEIKRLSEETEEEALSHE